MTPKDARGIRVIWQRVAGFTHEEIRKQLELDPPTDLNAELTQMLAQFRILNTMYAEDEE